MEILLVIAIVLVALGVIAQTAVLIAMYMMSRRISGKAEALVNDARGPLESVINNLKTVSNELAETGKVARAQAEHLQDTVAESRLSIRGHIGEVRGVVLDTVTDARRMILRPLREYSAIGVGIAEGVRTFLSGRKRREARAEKEQQPEHPAA